MSKQTLSFFSRSAARLAVVMPLALGLWSAPGVCRAQGASDTSAFGPRQDAFSTLSAAGRGADNSSLGRELLGFFNTGAYFLTGNGKSASRFGSPKFYNDVTFYGHARHIGSLELSGGAETLLLSDHFVPFTGGNEFDLLGASASLSTRRALREPRAYVLAGLYYGRLRSVNLGIDHSKLITSASVGVEYPFSPYLSLDASYRINGSIDGVNTDGFSVSLRIH